LAEPCRYVGIDLKLQNQKKYLSSAISSVFYFFPEKIASVDGQEIEIIKCGIRRIEAVSREQQQQQQLVITTSPVQWNAV